MKHFVKASSAKNLIEPFNLASLLSVLIVVPSTNTITLRDTIGVSLFKGTFGELFDLKDGDILTDAEGYEYEVSEAMLSDVSRVYINRNEIIVSIKL